MIEIETIIYKCDHCGKIYQRKFYCIKHEELCKMNPANDRPCFHCVYLEMQTIEYGEYDPNNGDYPYTGYAFFCNLKEHFVYPPYIKKPYLELEDPGENLPMPLTCEDKK